MDRLNVEILDSASVAFENVTHSPDESDLRIVEKSPILSTIHPLQFIMSLVGATEGALLTDGSVLGIVDGCTDGSSEGLAVGEDVGPDEGSTEGVELGISEGSTDGTMLTVGALVASTGGLMEGFPEGSEEGTLEGSPEGDPDGIVEGSHVLTTRELSLKHISPSDVH